MCILISHEVHLNTRSRNTKGRFIKDEKRRINRKYASDMNSTHTFLKGSRREKEIEKSKQN